MHAWMYARMRKLGGDWMHTKPLPCMNVHVNVHHGVEFEMSKDSFTHACVQQTRKSEGLHSCMQTRSVGISAVSAEQTGPFTMKGFAEIMTRPLHTEETCK